MVSYLRENSKTVEAHPSSKKRVMATIAEEPEAKSQRSMQETMDLFEEVVRQGSIYQAYQAFNSAPLRQSLRVPDALWKEMEPTLKEKINEVKQKIHEQRKREEPKQQGGIPTQYPSMKKAIVVDKIEESPKETMAELCQRLGEYTLADEDLEENEDAIFREFTSITMTVPEESDEHAIVI